MLGKSSENEVCSSVLVRFCGICLIFKQILDRDKNNLNLFNSIKSGLNQILAGFEKGAINMISLAVAIATAGLIVGAVSSTGLSNNLIIIVEAISGGNIIYLLGLTAFLCIILGMGLPTTANLGRVSSNNSSSFGNLLINESNNSPVPLPLILDIEKISLNPSS